MEIIIILVFISVIVYALYSSSTKQKKESSKPAPYNIKSVSYEVRQDQHYSADADRLWIPQNQPVTISGYRIDGGLIYVGEGLGSLRNPYSPDPALINPKLKVNNINPDHVGSSMTYWPSYSDIKPAARAAYLDWLSTGRKNPTAYIGYVFLFFYGLERRLLIDSDIYEKARDEAVVIISEVERLLDIYGYNGSFNGYASSFLDIACLKFQIGDLPTVKENTQWGEYPISFKIALGHLSKSGKPISSEYALRWAEYHPEICLRTPATRCREEFETLFDIRYREKFGDGLIIEPNKTCLKINYKPATSSIHPMSYDAKDLPDLTRLSKPISQIRGVIDQCTEELSAYSRLIGRKPEEKSSLSAISLLPKELITQMNLGNVASLRKWAQNLLQSQDAAELPARELLNFMDINGDKALSKSDCVSIAQMLGILGYGIEPDIRFGDHKIDPAGKAVLFSLEENEPRTPSPSYKAAAAALHLATAISAADGSVSEAEELHLERHLESSLHLSQPERKRLRAYMKWLILFSPGFSSLRKYIASLDDLSRKSIGFFLINVAHADGIVDPDEIKTLKKIYKLLKLDEETIYSDIHSIQSGGATEPVTVQKASLDHVEYPIPERAFSAPETGDRALVLDHNVIEKRRQDTQLIHILLSDIFSQEEEQVVAESQDFVQSSGKIQTVFGLDESHGGLARELAVQNYWSREDFERLCDKYGLMPDGAMETINVATYDLFDNPFIEEDDGIEINPDIAKEITT
ncbi:MAG: tellurite resistance TerB family protein [Candidatus Dadabacteria bacterium]|nr:tellurite resistance TerB family protein [Candidatus Dadabacteria bacterium]